MAEFQAQGLKTSIFRATGLGVVSLHLLARQRLFLAVLPFPFITPGSRLSFKKIFALALIFSFILVSGNGCARAPNAPRGLVVIGSNEHDFGELKQEEIVNHAFNLFNNSDDPLEIVDVKSSCGCLVADPGGGLISHRIDAGKVLILPIRWTTGGAQEIAAGQILVGYLKTSETNKASSIRYLKLRVRADVTAEYSILPRTIDFGTIGGLASQQITRTVNIVPLSFADIAILDASTTSSFIKIQAITKRPANAGTDIKIAVDASRFTESRSFEGTVLLVTNSKRMPKTLIRVVGKYEAVVQAVPNTIVIGSDELGVIKREIRITTYLPARIRNIICSSLNSAAIEASKGLERNHLLHVSIPQCKGAGLSCELEVELEFSEEGKTRIQCIKIPVHRFSTKGS